MKTGNQVSYEWLISGRVQGVGFRWFTVRAAERTGARGWVENLPDGRVRVVATLEAKALPDFEAALNRGPLMARVERVERLKNQDDMDRYNSFIAK